MADEDDNDLLSPEEREILADPSVRARLDSARRIAVGTGRMP